MFLMDHSSPKLSYLWNGSNKSFLIIWKTLSNINTFAYGFVFAETYCMIKNSFITIYPSTDEPVNAASTNVSDDDDVHDDNKKIVDRID